MIATPTSAAALDRSRATDIIARLVRGTSDTFLPGCRVDANGPSATFAVEVSCLERGRALVERVTSEISDEVGVPRLESHVIFKIGPGSDRHTVFLTFSTHGEDA